MTAIGWGRMVTRSSPCSHTSATRDTALRWILPTRPSTINGTGLCIANFTLGRRPLTFVSSRSWRWVGTSPSKRFHSPTTGYTATGWLPSRPTTINRAWFCVTSFTLGRCSYTLLATTARGWVCTCPSFYSDSSTTRNTAFRLGMPS